VYVLWSASARCYYIGISQDPQARLQQHNAGSLRGWTARHRPWELAFVEEHPHYQAARKRELELKAQKGGRGVVWKARDTHLDRFVALKTLPAEKLSDPERKRRSVQEVKAASALNHANIPFRSQSHWRRHTQPVYPPGFEAYRLT
jgi:predicted GIY-YIG superfamily endonuclease